MLSILKASLHILRETASLLRKHHENSVDLGVKHKSDASPVTIADHEAHQHIERELQKLTPEWPVISEESTQIPSLPLKESIFWLVDPLDGTREFIQRSGEFSINLSLIREYRPILGIVMLPMQNQVYWAIEGQGAFLQIDEQPEQAIQVKAPDEQLIIAISRSHHQDQKPEWQTFINWAQSLNKSLGFRHSGSAIKLAWVAQGLADIYPRIGGTGAWDTAAGQCILEEAGGCVIDLKGKSLRYGDRATLQNPYFLATTPYYRDAWLRANNKRLGRHENF